MTASAVDHCPLCSKSRLWKRVTTKCLPRFLGLQFQVLKAFVSKKLSFYIFQRFLYFSDFICFLAKIMEEFLANSGVVRQLCSQTVVKKLRPCEGTEIASNNLILGQRI